MKLIKVTPIALVASMLVSNAFATEAVLNDVVVTAAPMTTPTTIELDPKVPRQPLPAHDGADFLKSVPGFSIMRKAGTDGEPNFRGMGGSRVNILADDQNIFGGCGQRMDAPTAYIFPEIYDKVTVVKGPQTVLYPGHGSAATVRFEKEQKTYDKPAYDVHASGLVGSFGRHDEVVDANVGNKGYFANFTGSNSYSDDYKDGSGNAVHSKYHRYSASSSFGVTPDDNKRFEISAGRSNGYAAYADRTMDGTKFLRENVAMKGQVKNISDVVEKLDVQVSRNTIFHTMASGILRSGSVGGMDVAHDTNAARVSADLALRPTTKAKVGIDYADTSHSGNMSMGAALADDAVFKNTSLFGEIYEQLNKNRKLIAGYRADLWDLQDKRTSGTTAGQNRSEVTNSGFTRVEEVLSLIPNTTAFVGLGHAERMPDYWELISNKSNTSAHSAFLTTKTEKTNQIDIGLINKTDVFDLNASVFYNKIKDYIMTDNRSGYQASYSCMGSMTCTSPVSRNIDARTYGAEVGAGYKLTDTLKLNSSVFYVKGKNETDNLPLAQLAPLEGRISVAYDDKKYSYGALLRLVAPKDEVAVGQGNIAGQDVSKSGGFGIFSLNAGYKPNKKTLIAAGVDNLFDKTYAEFVSRAGADVGGSYVQTTRVNEPGRTAWLKATIALD
jgi:iron complex outermembrane recepter protein